MREGKVFLIGAGPGDPGLLTLRGAEILGMADVVLYDALAHPSLLRFARPGAECRSVGKRYGEESPSQDAINAQLVELARSGKVVARLKGGDPFFFARGSEEAEILAEQGIAFEVVPGVISPIGAAAYAGISLTHRDWSSSVAIVTGTESPGKVRTSHDWAKLACATQTLCVIMGMRRLPEITDALIEHGRPPETPAAVIQWGSWPRQRVVEGTLADISARVAEAKLTNPGVIVVGQVVTLREHLRWFDNRPLFGKRIALLRPIDQCYSTEERLRQRGAEPLVRPAIRLAPPSDAAPFRGAIENLHTYDVVLFTSVNGVSATWRELRTLGRDARAFGNSQVGAIGPATAFALEMRGIYADIVAQEFRGEGLARAVLSDTRISASATTPRRILLARAEVARDALPDALRAAGHCVDVVAAYRMVDDVDSMTTLRDELACGGVDAIILSASSTATELRAVLGEDSARLLAHVDVASIGPVTTETAERLGIKVHVTASEYTLDGVIDALERYYGPASDSSAQPPPGSASREHA